MDSDPLGLRDTDRDAAHADLFATFYALVHRLRRECPWDRVQTPDSVKHLTLEEAYETVEAIDTGDASAVKQELGDLFLHVLFHAVMAEEAGTFTLHEVMEAIMAKLVRRHPHVFGAVTVQGAAEVVQNWEAIKQAERIAEDQQAPKSALSGVPGALPALLRAERIQEKAAAVGFDFPNGAGAWEKVEEELREFQDAVHGAAPLEALEEEMGDVLFALVNYARFVGVTPENALRKTTQKFQRRFAFVETGLAARGKTPTAATLEEMDALWDQAKAQERA